jgi:AraC-like DNA-binding protein
MMPLFYKPHPALTGLVNNFMISHVKSDTAQKKLTFPFPPLPEHCIFFYPFDKPTIENVATKQIRTHSGCIVTGPNTDRLNLTFGYNHLVIKIGFQPGGLYRLLGFPMEEMLGYGDFDGAEVFGNEINDTVDALSNATCNAEMIAIAESFLFFRAAKLKKLGAIDHVIPDILKYSGMVKIDQLSKKAEMSNRQFERVFKERIGLSPKFYSRLVRFSKAWIMKEIHSGSTWTEIAYQCGYFDQMHLIRDFQAFAGTNPKIIAEALEQQPFSLNNRIFY